MKINGVTLQLDVDRQIYGNNIF